MKDKFLTKKTKISLKEETPPNGKREYEKIHKEDGDINEKALKDISTKLKDYYGDQLKELDPILKVDRQQDSPKDMDPYEVEALGAGKMSSLKYDNEGSEVADKFDERIDKLNDTSEYDKDFGNNAGLGQRDEDDQTYHDAQEHSQKYSHNKYGGKNPQSKPSRVRVTNTNESKNNKMKRLNFKNEFTSEEQMKELIPENYKQDNHVFLMSDGNQTFKVRWDKSLNEGTILNYKNQNFINENVEKMKKLFNYKYSDSMGKTNNYGEETKSFKTIMENVKGKELLGE